MVEPKVLYKNLVLFESSKMSNINPTEETNKNEGNLKMLKTRYYFQKQLFIYLISTADKIALSYLLVKWHNAQLRTSVL